MATYRRARSTRLLLIGLLLASLVTITIDSRSGDRGPLAALGRIGLSIVTPLQEGVSAVVRPIGSFFSNVIRAGSLRARNEALEAELARLRTQIQQSSELRQQHAELLRLVQLEEDVGVQGFGARVVAEGPSNYEWTVVVDKGSADGVYEDMPVMSGSGLVGRVVRTAPSAAQVMLITDPDSFVTARLADSGEIGQLQGNREEDLRFTLVDPEAEVQPGELVVTSGFRLGDGTAAGIFPAQIPIGEVSVVENDPANLERVVHVRPYVDFTRLDLVLMVQWERPDISGLNGQPSETP
ncbi:MAG TPA: rod shape-determining protein MreC [Actinomycetota bacterium]|nr:rod shape-determining protein MreC [Actinomycetota bacterium]